VYRCAVHRYAVCRYNKSVAELMICWSVQKGYISIPKTSKPERMLHNARVFDWTISPQDIDILVNVRLIMFNIEQNS